MFLPHPNARRLLGRYIIGYESAVDGD